MWDNFLVWMRHIIAAAVCPFGMALAAVFACVLLDEAIRETQDWRTLVGAIACAGIAWGCLHGMILLAFWPHRHELRYTSGLTSFAWLPGGRSPRGTSMTFEHSILIRAAPAQLFALTQDYTRRLEWDPFLRTAELLGGATEAGIGVRANCVAKSGLAMETEYVSFNPPHTTAVKMTRGPWFIDSFAGSWRFEESSPGTTRVYFRYHVKARPRWLAPLLSPFLAWVFARDTRKRLAGLKHAVEERGLLNETGSAA